MLTTLKKSCFLSFCSEAFIYDPIHLHKFDKHLVTNAPANSSAVVYELFQKKKKEKKRRGEGEGRRKARNETFPRGESPKLNSFITILALIAGKGKKK